MQDLMFFFLSRVNISARWKEDNWVFLSKFMGKAFIGNIKLFDINTAACFDQKSEQSFQYYIYQFCLRL